LEEALGGWTPRGSALTLITARCINEAFFIKQCQKLLIRTLCRVFALVIKNLRFTVVHYFNPEAVSDNAVFRAMKLIVNSRRER
jgi:hypothetical protein